MDFRGNFHTSNRKNSRSRNFTRKENHNIDIEFRSNYDATRNFTRNTHTPANVDNVKVSVKGKADWVKVLKNYHGKRKEWSVQVQCRKRNWEDERRRWNEARGEMTHRLRRQKIERKREMARMERAKLRNTSPETLPVFQVVPNVMPRKDPRKQCSQQLQHLIDLSLTGSFTPYGFK